MRNAVILNDGIPVDLQIIRIVNSAASVRCCDIPGNHSIADVYGSTIVDSATLLGRIVRNTPACDVDGTRASIVDTASEHLRFVSCDTASLQVERPHIVDSAATVAGPAVITSCDLPSSLAAGILYRQRACVFDDVSLRSAALKFSL